jgi:hypothetical protein
VIIPGVGWYLRSKLSFRDLVKILPERGLYLDPTTILRWLRRHVREFVKRWNRFDRFAGGCLRFDQACLKVRGEWIYLNRALDKTGQTVDFRLAEVAMWAQPKLSYGSQSGTGVDRRHTITFDGYAASDRAVREMRTERLLPKDQEASNSRWQSRFSATLMHIALEQGHLFSLPCHRSKGALP